MTLLERFKKYGTPIEVRLLLSIALIQVITNNSLRLYWYDCILFAALLVTVSTAHAMYDEWREKEKSHE